MVEYKGKLWIIGGSITSPNGNGSRNDVWTSEDGENWTRVRAHNVDSGPHPTTESQVVVYNGLLYVFNGTRNTIQTSSDGITWEYVAWTGSVNDGTHYPPLQGHQVVVFSK